MNPPAPYRIGVISDTHGRLSSRVFEIFKDLDMILHAGDIGSEDVLDALEIIAPVSAVAGNVDHIPPPHNSPMIRELETPAGRIGMTHGHLPSAPSSNHAKLVRHFSKFKPAIIVFGHSHIPCLEKLGEVILFNPGSASLSRWGKGNSVGLITAVPGSPLKLEHFAID